MPSHQIKIQVLYYMVDIQLMVKPVEGLKSGKIGMYGV